MIVYVDTSARVKRYVRETLSTQVTLATYDRELWLAGQKAGMKIWPEGLY